MFLDDIVGPMGIEEAKATSQRLDAKCWKGYKKQGTKVKGGVRVNNCVPKESQINELAAGYAANKGYDEIGKYKRYNTFVSKKKYNNIAFIAVAEHPVRKEVKFRTNAPTQQEAVQKLHAEIDKEIDVATKVSGSATVDFNVDFVRDILEMSSDTFYAKLVAGPKLVIAGKEMEQYPDIMKSEGFKASSIRTVSDSEGSTKLPAMSLSASGAVAAQLIANGRYVLGAETIDRDGNRIFDLEFDSVVEDPRERVRMGVPAITIGTKRAAKEDSWHGQTDAWHAGDNAWSSENHEMVESNPEDYDDEEDQETDLRTGDYVRDTMDGESGEIFRMVGDPYERRVRILDRDGKGWYIEPSRLTRVDPQDPDVQRYFGKKRQRDIDEDQWDSGEDVTVTQDDQSTTYQYKGAKFVVSGEEAQGEAWWYEPGDSWREADHYNYVYDESKGIDRFYNEDGQNVFNLSATNQSKVEQFVKAKAKDFLSTMVAQPNLPRMHEQGVAEGWSDAIVSQRTGSPRTPYSVYIKGKKWKDFENEDHAQAVANKLRAKFKAEGRDPETITIAPTDMSEEWSKKYKSSINCSDPKGFSQKAHCAGKKKNESVTESTNYWSKLQNERSTRLNTLVNELKESVKDIK